MPHPRCLGPARVGHQYEIQHFNILPKLGVLPAIPHLRSKCVTTSGFHDKSRSDLRQLNPDRTLLFGVRLQINWSATVG
jgi:hypothetical protein